MIHVLISGLFHFLYFFIYLPLHTGSSCGLELQSQFVSLYKSWLFNQVESRGYSVLESVNAQCLSPLGSVCCRTKSAIFHCCFFGKSAAALQCFPLIFFSKL